MKDIAGNTGSPKQIERDEISNSLTGSETPQKIEYRGEFFGELPYYIGIGPWSPQLSETSSDQSEKFLSLMELACIASVLEDAVDELVILKYVIGAPYVPWDLHYSSVEERFNRRITPERIFPEVDSKPALTSDIKLQRDREHIEVILNRTTRALLEEGSYFPLLGAVEALKTEEDVDNQLIQELKANLEYLKDIKARVEEKRKLDDLEEKERDELMYQLQDEADDIILKCNVEEKFVDKWENVRNAQNSWKLKNAENYYKDNISKFNTKAKMEKRVTNEMQAYLKLNQAELEEQLEEWMARYDSEMERRENKILHLKYNRDQAEEKKHNLRELYENRKVEMKEWITFRTIRRKRTEASLQIQSWWRGIMVRKKLGPYKPKKGGGGGEKKEGGGKKKKKK